MKLKLLVLLLLCSVTNIFSQGAVIQGDEMLCPNSTGTAIVMGFIPYDTYQWQVKQYGATEFTDIEGATNSTFTYDAYTYSVTTIRAKVTQNGETLYSNELFIDSMVFLPIFYSTETTGNVTFDADTLSYVLCDGATVVNTVGQPYTNVQWYKDGEPIAGATQQSYTITTPGTYYAVAAPESCPDSTQTTLPCSVVACSTSEVTAPVIDGDLMLCPNTNGTAQVTNNQTYDTYQWYFKYWFLSDDFAPIEGATSASFTYDWYTYDQALFKLVVTRDGQTYESNTIQIDSHNWAGLLVNHTFNEDEVYVNPDNGNFMMCPGSSIQNTVGSPYTIVQWYKDGEPIEGATATTYTFTEPGVYTVTAAPAICPESTSTTLEIVVELRTDCEAGVNNRSFAGNITLYPNPASSILNVQLNNNTTADAYVIYDVTGKQLATGSLNGNLNGINIDNLAAGSYLIKISSANGQATRMFAKQ